MTYMIHHPESGKVLHHSICRPYTAADAYTRADAVNGEDVLHYIAADTNIRAAVVDGEDFSATHGEDVLPYTAADANIRAAVVDGEDFSATHGEAVLPYTADYANIRAAAVDGEDFLATHGKTSSGNALKAQDPDIDPEPPPVVYMRPEENFNGHHMDNDEPPDDNPGNDNLEDLIGRTFLAGASEDGTRDRIRFKEIIDKHDRKIQTDPRRARFRVAHEKELDDDIMTYNEILNHLENDESQNVLWKNKRIPSHQGPLHTRHPDYKRGPYNVMIECENGEISSEPMHVIAKDNLLLDIPDWKRFKAIAKRHKKYIRFINQAKL